MNELYRNRAVLREIKQENMIQIYDVTKIDVTGVQ